MPKSIIPNVPDGYMAEEDLTAFAVSQGQPKHLAVRLFNRLLRTVMDDLKKHHGVELDVRYIGSPATRWPRDAARANTEVFDRAGLMISVKSLEEAVRHLYPNYSWQYGKVLDDLLKAWVRSLR